MFQITNDKAIRGMIIGTIVIVIATIGITIGLILAKNNIKTDFDNNFEKQPVQVLKNDGIQGASLFDKYNENSLNIEKVSYTQGERQVQTEYGDIYSVNKLDLNYIKISGLKNKEIEEKINEEICNKAFGMYTQEMLNDEKTINISIDTQKMASFSNVLSVIIDGHMEKYAENGEEEFEDFDVVYLNYNLQTGEKIEFKDLFTYNAPIKSIIGESAYESLAWEYLNETSDMSQVEYGKLENRVYNIVVEYLNNPNINFGFNNRYICMYINNDYIEIDMTKYYNSIAIYNRFLTNISLYEDDSIGCKNAFIFSKRYGNKDYVESGENYYIDIIWQSDVDNSWKEQREEFIQNELNEKINNIRNYVSNNKDKAVVVTIGVSEFEKDDSVEVTYSVYKYLMSKSYFDSVVYNDVKEETQAINGDAQLSLNYDTRYVRFEDNYEIIMLRDNQDNNTIEKFEKESEEIYLLNKFGKFVVHYHENLVETEMTENDETSYYKLGLELSKYGTCKIYAKGNITLEGRYIVDGNYILCNIETLSYANSNNKQSYVATYKFILINNETMIKLQNIDISENSISYKDEYNVPGNTYQYTSLKEEIFDSVYQNYKETLQNKISEYERNLANYSRHNINFNIENKPEKQEIIRQSNYLYYSNDNYQIEDYKYFGPITMEIALINSDVYSRMNEINDINDMTNYQNQLLNKYLSGEERSNYTNIPEEKDRYYRITGMYILNGNTSNEEENLENGKAKMLVVTLNNEKKYTFNLENKVGPMLFDMDYTQKYISEPIHIQIEVIDSYSGKVTNDVYLGEIEFGIETNIPME